MSCGPGSGRAARRSINGFFPLTVSLNTWLNLIFCVKSSEPFETSHVITTPGSSLPAVVESPRRAGRGEAPITKRVDVWTANPNPVHPFSTASVTKAGWSVQINRPDFDGNPPVALRETQELFILPLRFMSDISNWWLRLVWWSLEILAWKLSRRMGLDVLWAVESSGLRRQHQRRRKTARSENRMTMERIPAVKWAHRSISEIKEILRQRERDGRGRTCEEGVVDLDPFKNVGRSKVLYKNNMKLFWEKVKFRKFHEFLFKNCKNDVDLHKIEFS